MSIGDIVRTIDTQLSSLLQARDLLTQSAAPRTSSARRRTRTTQNKSIKLPMAQKAQPSRRLGTVAKSDPPRAKRAAAKGKTPRPKALRPAESLPADAVAESANAMELLPSSAMDVATLAIPVTKVAPSRRTSFRPGRTRAKGERARVATALNHEVPSGVVVVSPEQAQKAREREHRPEVAPRRPTPATPMAGRRAFEALFGRSTV